MFNKTDKILTFTVKIIKICTENKYTNLLHKIVVTWMV